MKPPKGGKPPGRTALPVPTSYEVGYRKPPVHSRFQPGRSGNSKGRPKGAKTHSRPAYAERLKDIVLEEAYRMIGVRDGRREIKVPMAQAIVRALAVNAAKGQQRAQRLFTELLATVKRENRRLHDEWLQVAINYKVEWEQELERRRRCGIVAPDPLPHPGHVQIDFRTGSVSIQGPMTKEEQAELEVWRTRRAAFAEEVEALKVMLEEGCDEMTEADIRDELAKTERVVEVLDRLLPKAV